MTGEHSEKLSTYASAGAVIFLHGPSSSGKSTLATGLQQSLEEPFWHFSIDHLIDAKCLPSSRIESGEFQWRELRDAFFDGFHRCIPALALAGNNLIVEHIVERKEWMLSLIELLNGFDVFCVRFDCPLPELERRAILRGEAKLQEAIGDFANPFQMIECDLAVDSTDSAEQSVAAICDQWRRRQHPSAFMRIRQQES